MAECADTYGDLEEQADPSWMDRTRRWSWHRRSEWLFQAGGWAFLNDGQVQALLQGLPPPPNGWGELPYSLEEASAAWEQWQRDRAMGCLPERVTPNDLAAWCDAHRIELPEPFVMGVQHFHVKKQDPLLQAAEPVELASWIPIKVSSVPYDDSEPRKPGRKAIRDDFIVAARQAANVLYAEMAASGQRSTQKQLAGYLAERPEFRGYTPGSILRAITGGVNHEKHKVIAACST
jgi:hypothetical protein